MKANRVISLLTFLILFFAAVAQAQTLEGKKVAYVDLSKVFDQYKKTKEYDSVLEKKHSEYEKERNKRVEKLKDEQNKIALLKEEERVKVQGDLEKGRNELMEYDRQQQTDLRKDRDDKIREILLEIEKVVSDYAKKEKYAFIFNDRVLIFGGEEYDITDVVIKLLNDSYSSKSK